MPNTDEVRLRRQLLIVEAERDHLKTQLESMYRILGRMLRRPAVAEVLEARNTVDV